MKLALLAFLALPLAAQQIPLPNGDHVTLDSSPAISYSLGKHIAIVTITPCGVDSMTGKHSCYQEFRTVYRVPDSAQVASLLSEALSGDTVTFQHTSASRDTVKK